MKRARSNYTWACDGCMDKHQVLPGFEFYSCEKCRMDWCNKPKCFALVEEVKIIPRTITNLFDSGSDKKSKKSMRSKYDSIKSHKDQVIDAFSSVDGLSQFDPYHDPNRLS